MHTKTSTPRAAFAKVFSDLPKSNQYVYGILYLLKGDMLADKKIYAQTTEWKKLRIALSSSHPIHKSVALLLYLLREYAKYTPPLQWTLRLLWILGPSRSWFAYLLRSKHRDTLLSATHILRQDFRNSVTKKMTYVLDIGSGVGHLVQNFPKQNGLRWVCVDKNFFSLFLAQHYHARNDTLYVCTDVEMSEAFVPGSFHTIMCLDCFAWIYEKHGFIKKMYEILQENGSLHIVNVHAENDHTQTWGYGIGQSALKSLLRTVKYRTIHMKNNSEHLAETPLGHQRINSLGYSVSAKK